MNVDPSGMFVFYYSFYGDATFGLGAYGSINFAFDDKGNTAIQYAVTVVYSYYITAGIVSTIVRHQVTVISQCVSYVIQYTV